MSADRLFVRSTMTTMSHNGRLTLNKHINKDNDDSRSIHSNMSTQAISGAKRDYNTNQKELDQIVSQVIETFYNQNEILENDLNVKTQGFQCFVMKTFYMYMCIYQIMIFM